MHDQTHSTTRETDPYDRLLNSRPIRAARDANALIRENRRLYAFGLLVALVSTALNLATATEGLSRWLGVRGLGLALMPAVWLLFYAAVIHHASRRTTPLRETLSESFTRYRAYLGAHVLSRGVFWGVTLTTLLGLAPIALFILGYSQKTATTIRTDYIVTDSGSAIVPVVVIAATLGFIVTYYLQFIDLEAVLNDQSPLTALRASRRLVSANHRAVIGYVAVRTVLVGIATLPMAVSPVLGGVIPSPFDAAYPDIAIMYAAYWLIITGVLTVINTVLLTFLGAYHVQFYRSIRE